MELQSFADISSCPHEIHIQPLRCYVCFICNGGLLPELTKLQVCSLSTHWQFDRDRPTEANLPSAHLFDSQRCARSRMTKPRVRRRTRRNTSWATPSVYKTVGEANCQTAFMQSCTFKIQLVKKQKGFEGVKAAFQCCAPRTTLTINALSCE